MWCGHAGAGWKTRPRTRPGQTAPRRGNAQSARHGIYPQGWTARPGGALPPGGQRSSPGKGGPANPADRAGQDVSQPGTRAAPAKPAPRNARRPGKDLWPARRAKREAICGTGRTAQADNAGSRANRSPQPPDRARKYTDPLAAEIDLRPATG
jgi:hypothetical protein